AESFTDRVEKAVHRRCGLWLGPSAGKFSQDGEDNSQHLVVGQIVRTALDDIPRRGGENVVLAALQCYFQVLQGTFDFLRILPVIGTPAERVQKVMQNLGIER